MPYQIQIEKELAKRIDQKLGELTDLLSEVPDSKLSNNR